jgi:basic membrane protein A
MDKTLTDPVWGAQMADSLITKGSDVIFGAGRKTGNGAVVEAAARSIYVIGDDIDQYYALPAVAPMMLTSAMKEVTPGVTELVTMAWDAQNRRAVFPSGNFTGTAGFAPYHDLDSKVPLYVKSMMDELNTGLLNDTIRTNIPAARP